MWPDPALTKTHQIQANGGKNQRKGRSRDKRQRDLGFDTQSGSPRIKGLSNPFFLVVSMTIDFASPLLLAWTLGIQEILICAVVFLLLFGSAKLPSLMRNMGRSINEFKAGMKDKPTTTRIEDESAEQDKVHS